MQKNGFLKGGPQKYIKMEVYVQHKKICQNNEIPKFLAILTLHFLKLPAAGYPTILRNLRFWVRKLTFLGFLADFTKGK